MAANTVNNLETRLNDLFVKNAPKLPEGGKKALVQWSPIVSLVIGILTLLSAWSLWHWARAASALVNYANQLCGIYGTGSCGVATSRYSLWLWLGLIFLVVEGVLYVCAYSGLKAHKRQGWNYLYYGALVNVIYAIVSLFTDYNKVSHFVGALIGSAIGFYLLFQIREYYLDKKLPVANVPKTTPKGPATPETK